MLKSDKYEQYYNEEEKSAKRSKMKKMLIGILVFLAIIIVVVLCVVFLVILKKDDNNNTVYPGYKLSRLLNNDTNIFQAELQYLGSDDNYVNMKTSPIIKNLTFSAIFDSDNELTLRFIDSKNDRFTLPYAYPFPHNKMPPNQSSNKLYEFEYSENPFYIKVLRKSTNETIFSNDDLNFVYSDRYLEISTFLPTEFLYGLGERRQNFLYKPGTYTIWPKDQYATIDNATGPNHQTYGHHPMYLMKEQSGNFHVVFLRNSNAMDCIISGKSKVLTYKITGGIIEFKLFFGDKKPDTSLKLYHNYINGYTLMPFWSLGYHQSRWGYTSSKQLLNVVNNFSEYDIPLDTIWSDIDYMENYRDFTLGADFLRSDFDAIFNQSIHWVPILDFGIYRDTDNSSAYQRGNKSDVFIKSFFTEAPLIACVWPGLVSFPDFNHPNASIFWGEEIGELYQKIPFSGIWLDMNEPSNFVEGEVLNLSQHCGLQATPMAAVAFPENSNKRLLRKIETYGNNYTNTVNDHSTDNLYIYSGNLPYIPGIVPLENKTISMNATHYFDGVYLKSSEVITEIDFHSLNGFLESKATYDFLKQNLSQPLPFILSRSNMFGSGAVSFHWTGDNYAGWEFLQTSISEIFNFQLFGIPFSGVDLCGFAGNTTEELCTRFMQAGSLYPFSRNHNSIDAISQEPYAWGVNSTVFKASRASLKLRYSLLKWYYSVFIRNNGTGSVFRPMFFEFPDDPYLYELHDQFLIGREILVAPVLEANKSTNWVYFVNNTIWYDFFNGSLVYNYPGKFVQVDASLDSTPPIFIQGGSIVYLQDSTGVKKTKDLNNNFKLKVALNANLTAEGYMLGINDYNNDSNVVDSCTGANNCLVKINAIAVQVNDFQIDLSISFEKTMENSILQEIYITDVEVFGVPFENSYNAISYHLNQSFLVQQKSSIEFNYTFNNFYKMDSYSFDGKKFIGNLFYQGEETYYQNNLLCPIIKNVTLTITYDSTKELTILFDNANKSRFTLPYASPFPYTKQFSFSGNQEYYFEIANNSRFSLKIIRNLTKEVIFDTSKYFFIYSDNYLEISTGLPSQYLYGLGERRQGFLYKDGTYTIWPKDQYEMMDNATGPDHQTYGQHPVYLMRESSSNFHVVLLRNNHAMDVAVSNNVSKLTYRVAGGVFEFKIFIGDQKPDSVLKLYHEYLNGYTLPPFWAMGYHQSRWGYNSSAMLLEVVQNFSINDLPLDTIWSDIDYMNNFEDFTIGSAFLKQDFDTIRNKYSVNWVPILDIGVAYGDGNNSAYLEGLSMDVYVKSSLTNKSLLNCVWPGKVSYPDFNHPNASIFWKNQLQKLYDLIPYDGLWLDMNEPSAFVDGELPLNTECPPTPMPTPNNNARLLSVKSDVNSFYSGDLPYVPGLKPLENKTISMNSTHSSQGKYISKEAPFTEFDYHGLSGYLESHITFDFLQNNVKQNLPFILSRNTLFSQGAFSFHWTGDNLADWSFFQTSISEIFNFQIFGIPFVGVDLCGFGGDTTEELCSRWMQAGAFFPFSRNHNQIYKIPQEPYAWGVNSSVYQASHQSLKMRYSLLKWYYSIFVRNNGTGSVFRPLFFDYNDVESLKIEDQFLLGNEIMIAPIVTINTTSRYIYFPGDGIFWFDFFNASNVYLSGLKVNIENALNSTPPVFQRAGSIIYTQKTDSVKTVNDLSNNFTLKIALENKNKIFSALGYMMAIENYTNSNDVNTLCSGNANCLLNITATGALDSNDKLKLTISFNQWSSNTNIQKNYVNRVEIVGIVKPNGEYSSFAQDFVDPVLCSNGTSITINQ